MNAQPIIPSAASAASAAELAREDVLQALAVARAVHGFADALAKYRDRMPRELHAVEALSDALLTRAQRLVEDLAALELVLADMAAGE